MLGHGRNVEVIQAFIVEPVRKYMESFRVVLVQAVFDYHPATDVDTCQFVEQQFRVGLVVKYCAYQRRVKDPGLNRRDVFVCNDIKWLLMPNGVVNTLSLDA